MRVTTERLQRLVEAEGVSPRRLGRRRRRATTATEPDAGGTGGERDPASISLIDGITMSRGDSWAQLLPDADEPVFHIYAEGADEGESPAASASSPRCSPCSRPHARRPPGTGRRPANRRSLPAGPPRRPEHAGAHSVDDRRASRPRHVAASRAAALVAAPPLARRWPRSPSFSWLAAFVAVEVAIADRIGPGVEVAGVAVGDLTVAEAEERAAEDLAAQAAPRDPAHRRRAAEPDHSRRSGIDRRRAGDGACRARARPARAAARSLRVAPVRRRATPSLWSRVDVDAYETGLEAVRAAVDVARRDATLELRRRRGRPSCPARTASRSTRSALEHAILATLAEGRAYAGEVPVTAVPPEVSTAEAEERAGAAATYLSCPLTLRLRDVERRAVARRRWPACSRVNTGERRRPLPADVRQPARQGASARALRLGRDAARGRRDRRPRRGRHHGAAEQGRHRPRHGAAGRRHRRRRLRRRPAPRRRRPAPRPCRSSRATTSRAWGWRRSARSSRLVLRPLEPGPQDQHRPRGQARRRHHRRSPARCSRSTRPWGRAASTAASTSLR